MKYIKILLFILMLKSSNQFYAQIVLNSIDSVQIGQWVDNFNNLIRNNSIQELGKLFPAKDRYLLYLRNIKTSKDETKMLTDFDKMYSYFKAEAKNLLSTTENRISKNKINADYYRLTKSEIFLADYQNCLSSIFLGLKYYSSDRINWESGSYDGWVLSSNSFYINYKNNNMQWNYQFGMVKIDNTWFINPAKQIEGHYMDPSGYRKF